MPAAYRDAQILADLAAALTATNAYGAVQIGLTGEAATSQSLPRIWLDPLQWTQQLTLDGALIRKCQVTASIEIAAYPGDDADARQLLDQLRGTLDDALASIASADSLIPSETYLHDGRTPFSSTTENPLKLRVSLECVQETLVLYFAYQVR